MNSAAKRHGAKKIGNRPSKRGYAPRICSWIFLMTVIASTYYVVMYIVEPKLLPIVHIQLTNSSYFFDSGSLRPYLKGFFSTNVLELKKILSQQPYLDEVIIKRIWPDTLQVTLVEQKLIARWNEDAALTSKNKIVKASYAKVSDLPQFLGPESQSSAMLNNFLIMRKILQPLNNKITELDVNSRYSWQLILSDGLKINLGRDNILERLQTLMTIFPKLKRIHGNKIDEIDTRHPHGISVHLKSDATE